jgi:hypothetical protein
MNVLASTRSFGRFNELYDPNEFQEAFGVRNLQRSYLNLEGSVELLSSRIFKELSRG